MNNMICEGCGKIIENTPHIEKVWLNESRQYWHTNCFVYAHPPYVFPPPENVDLFASGRIKSLSRLLSNE